MIVRIDGDGCPGINELYNTCKTNNVEMIVYTDYAHQSNDKPYEIKLFPIGQDSVDLGIVNDCNINDIVITQDYGLSALLLSKGVHVLHVSGTLITNDNIDSLLMQRFLGKKHRDSGIRTKHKKRTKDIDDLLNEMLIKLIQK